MGTIAITGSASGIGRASADQLRAAGHRVIGIDRHEADVEADLATRDGRAAAIRAVTELSADILDGLVTCAGLAGAPSRPGSSLVSVNYFGTIELLVGLRPLLARGTDASAVAISSNSTTCQPNVPDDVVRACLDADEVQARDLADAAGSLAAYPATKVAVARWVRRHATNRHWIGSGIRLNAVAPGLVETAMIAEGRADPEVGPLLDLFPIPLGRPGQPGEIAALIAFLLGAESRFFCGSVVFADGGTDALLRADDWPAPWAIQL